MPAVPSSSFQTGGPSCFDKIKMGFTIGFCVGMASGALFGGFSALRFVMLFILILNLEKKREKKAKNKKKIPMFFIFKKMTYLVYYLGYYKQLGNLLYRIINYRI